MPHLHFQRFDFVCLCLSIVATGCPSDRSLRRRLVVTEDSSRIQDDTTESPAWFFFVLGV